MTKTSINRLSGALDDLAAHMDTDQFALASSERGPRRGRRRLPERRKPRFRGR